MRRCVNESMRLYPHPPVLLRRAIVPDVLPGGYEVAAGQVSSALSTVGRAEQPEERHCVF